MKDRTQIHGLFHMNHILKTSLSSLLLPFAVFFCNTSHANWHYETEVFMGTEVSIRLWQEDQERARQLIKKVWNEMQRIDSTSRCFHSDSLLSEVNEKAGEEAVPITTELFRLIQKSFFFSKISEGLFDITYATVGQLYDYRNKIKPGQDTLEKQVKHINYQNVTLLEHPTRIRFKDPNLRIDLGGIAKGFAVDKSIEILLENNVKHAVVTAGGDSRYIGNHRDRPWHVGIQHPRDKSKTAFLLPVENESISTSGDYERYFIDDEQQRHHHIIHPESGKSPRELVSVTVIGKEATTTDALSTTLFVAGIEEGLKIIHLIPNYEAVFIDQRGKVHYSSGLVPPETITRNSP